MNKEKIFNMLEKVRDTIEFTASQLGEVKEFAKERFADNSPRVSPEEYFEKKFLRKLDQHIKRAHTGANQRKYCAKRPSV